MVVIRHSRQDPLRNATWCVKLFLILLTLTWLRVCFVIVDDDDQHPLLEIKKKPLDDLDYPAPGVTRKADSETKTGDGPISSISERSEMELYPVAGDRHMVTPPMGGKVSLVRCSSTKGNLSVLLHERWAPRGVARFLEMVASRYFQSGVPLFRCTDACQFGLSNNAKQTQRFFNKRLEDDPMWLPPGPNYRQNSHGVRRYPRGYWTYAGSGNHSRSNQFVLTLKPNKFMGGGSPWEVPIGELVGNESFHTLSQFYTGYREKGPSQGLLRREGITEKIRTQWPKLDYITGCNIIEEMTLPNKYGTKREANA
jgi:cyclophilin family peptidyl-prolyl cis-trans isomerase